MRLGRPARRRSGSGPSRCSREPQKTARKRVHDVPQRRPSLWPWRTGGGMSIWTAEEQAQLDYVEIETTRAGKPVKVRSPGVCVIDGDGIPREWDVVQGFGLSGA